MARPPVIYGHYLMKFKVALQSRFNENDVVNVVHLLSRDVIKLRH